MALNRSNTAVARILDDGGVEGPAADLATRLAARLELPTTFLKYENVLVMLAEREAWHGAFLAVDPATSPGLLLTEPYLSVEATVAVAFQSPIQSFAELDQPGRTIASVSDSAFGRRLAAAVRQAEVEDFPSPGQAWEALVAGRVDAAAGLRTLLAKQAADSSLWRVLEGSFAVLGQAIAINGACPGLFALAQDAVAGHLNR